MKNSREVLPFPIIALAVNGDVNAVNHVLKHFEHYIIKLSQKTLFDEMGNPHIHVEPEIKRILETKLIVAMMNFDLM
ncbi:helix-turn-helix domain-containing protein [Enterococcus faecium]|uniref:helix-turn-helix domain-containing protein n=1 Tax=Enterococcus faecium TaxID=1352 RepID=UPI0020730676|nr:helix-turn-helix domain-containing protein [Enterococcus faecium]MCM6878891.1 helix-turn-helix domain-containing protein [Enterococcus faecium]